MSWPCAVRTADALRRLFFPFMPRGRRGTGAIRCIVSKVFPRCARRAVSLSCVPALAAEGTTDLDQVVVTASRTPQTLAGSLAATTVIDRARIDRLQPPSLPDLLRGTPGLHRQYGGPGKVTTMSLRGTGGRKCW